MSWFWEAGRRMWLLDDTLCYFGGAWEMDLLLMVKQHPVTKFDVVRIILLYSSLA